MFCFVFCLFLKDEVLKVTGLILGTLCETTLHDAGVR